MPDLGRLKPIKTDKKTEKNYNEMARVRFHLDTRPTKDGRCHIKLSLSHNGSTALMPTGVFVKPEFWDPGDDAADPHIKKTCVGYKALNAIITQKFELVQRHLNELMLSSRIYSYSSATQVKNYIQDKIDGKQDERSLVVNHLRAFIETRVNKPSKSLYEETLKKIALYHDVSELRFEDITVGWLKNFESKLRGDGLAINSIARHMRQVRAVYNDAIDHGLAQLNDYPFRRYKIKHEKTQKRSLAVEQLRELRDYPCEPYQKRYRDIFMLIFYLGGINVIDLFKLKEMPNGRIDYVRSKTGVPVNIKVQPEALEIIERYRGKEHLLSMADEYKNHNDFLRRMDKELKKIGPVEMVLNAAKDPKKRKKNKKKIAPIFPKLSTYWARHSVATLMAVIDIPDATIDRVLAHADNTITAIYIKRDQKKVDDAMRKVIDFLNGSSEAEVQ